MSGGQYQNSGLSRYGSPIFGSLQSPYQPTIFAPPQLAQRKTFGPSVGPLAQSSYGGGFDSGAGGDAAPAGGTGLGGFSVNGAGQAGNALGSVFGGMLGGPLGASALGSALDSLAVSAASAGNGPGPDSATDPSSVGAVNGMDAASDAASGGGGGGGK